MPVHCFSATDVHAFLIDIHPYDGPKLHVLRVLSGWDDLSLSPAMDLMEPGGIPLSLHNLWVALLMLAMFAWFLQVLYRIFKAQIIHWRMRRSERGLLLDRMSIYATDLQHIIRQHFNQLLRIRPSVPAREIAQLYVLAHLHPESLRSEIVDGE